MKRVFVKSLLALCILSASASSQKYYFNTFEKAGENYVPYIKCLNLESRLITDSIYIGNANQKFKTEPILIENGSVAYVFDSMVKGIVDDDHYANQETTTYYIYSTSLDLLKKVELPIVVIEDITYNPYIKTIVSGMIFPDSGSTSSIFPTYRLNDDWDFVGYDPNGKWSGGCYYIGNFRSCIEYTDLGNRYFYVGNDSAYSLWLLRTDSLKKSITDSLKLNSESVSISTFVYNSHTGILYIFNFSEKNIHYLEKGNSDKIIFVPNVERYDPENFRLIDKYPLHIELPAGVTIMPSHRICEILGNYIVLPFAFKNSENYMHFSPAMLFIFDTRTNEATWLRVGWR